VAAPTTTWCASWSVPPPHDRHRVPALRRFPGRAALGYVEVKGPWRTDVFHLPVIAAGDGGAYTTTADMALFRTALMSERIVRAETLADIRTARSRPDPGVSRCYRLGIWLNADSLPHHHVGCRRRCLVIVEPPPRARPDSHSHLDNERRRLARGRDRRVTHLTHPARGGATTHQPWHSRPVNRARPTPAPGARTAESSPLDRGHETVTTQLHRKSGGHRSGVA
jgi:hypothetical protein